MSISDHIRIEKRFIQLEDELARLAATLAEARQEISHLKGRLTVREKKDSYEAADA
jgi:hypothetical protein